MLVLDEFSFVEAAGALCDVSFSSAGLCVVFGIEGVTRCCGTKVW